MCKADWFNTLLTVALASYVQVVHRSLLLSNLKSFVSYTIGCLDHTQFSSQLEPV